MLSDDRPWEQSKDMQAITDRSAEADDPSLRFEALISEQDQLCDSLEALADQLPDRIDTFAAANLAEKICSVLRSCQDLEEAEIFPVLLIRDADLLRMINRLRAEHVEDEDHAILVAEAINQFVRDPARSGADRLGYCIRALFQPLRRHVAFDRNIVLQLFRELSAR